MGEGNVESHTPANISFQKCLMILKYNTENA